MPDFRVPPISIVHQIRNNLQDRYESGFPILKELLQNADDSGAKRFCVEALSGWKSAEHPLLQSPGLLVANDGNFRHEDQDGIVSFGDSGKAADSAAIGKFGLGQKSVFHICDAFLVYAYDTGTTFSRVINPFLNVRVAGNVSRTWEPPGDGNLADADLKLLRNAVASEFPDRGLLLWFPLRRADLLPVPEMGFSTNIPDPSETIGELTRVDDIALTITALLHLERVQIRDDGATRRVIHLERNSKRLLGPTVWQNGTRKFSGAVSVQPSQTVRRYVGREAILTDGSAVELQRSPFWPKTVSGFDPCPKPEKGEPHGAVTLLRIANATTPTLRISWAVFLPIADSYDIEIPFAGDVRCQVRLLLHGYFFLDSGRRRIDGLHEKRLVGEPQDAAQLRRAWNTDVRDTVVLPLIPAVLRDALESKILTDAELEKLVRALAKHQSFHENRRAICGTHALARTLEEPNRMAWRTLPSKESLRPLPKSIAAFPKRIEELFPGVHRWASTNSRILCVDKEASLTAVPMAWVAHDLEALFALLSPRAFQSGTLASLLADFLEENDLSYDARQVIGPHLVAALRKAMDRSASMAPFEHLTRILSFVPESFLFPLPIVVEHRSILRSLAAARTSILPLRGSWHRGLPSTTQDLSVVEVGALLEALEPHLESRQADQAAVAALAILSSTSQSLSSLAEFPALASRRVLRARDVRTGNSVAISLEVLVERSQAGLLFASSPDANRLLPLVVEALPNASPLIVGPKTGDFLRQGGNSVLTTKTADKPAIFHLADTANTFGPEQARARLIEVLRPTIDDDYGAVRRLCTGVPETHSPKADLRVLTRDARGIERVVTRVLTTSGRGFLVPSSIADELTSKLRCFLQMQELDGAAIERLMVAHMDSIGSIELTDAEREAFLRSALSDDLLRSLPIHARSDGTIGGAENAFREAGFIVPQSLRDQVITIALLDDPVLRSQQETIVKPWAPENQITTALSMPAPHRLRLEILDAIAALSTAESEIDPDLSHSLRTKRWLVANDRPIAPEDVLVLPAAVDAAARAAFRYRGDAPPFELISSLSLDIRRHPAFTYLHDRILHNQHSSFQALALLVDDAKVVGRPGSVDSELVGDLALLLGLGCDLGLPGWELLRAGLAALKHDPDQSLSFVKAFSTFDVESPDVSARALDTLAKFAEDGGQTGEAARRLCLRGYRVVARWPKAMRCRVFAQTRVPTAAGGWRAGCEVIEEGKGIRLDHTLASDCASILRQNAHTHQPVVDLPPVGSVPTEEFANTDECSTVDLPQFEDNAAAKLRSFLRFWRSRVPSDLIVVFLGLLGRNRSLRALAEEMSADTTAEIDTLWNELGDHFRGVLYSHSLAGEVEKRRFEIKLVSGNTVRVETLSGDLFDAPLSGSEDGILVGNLHKKCRRMKFSDGREFDFFTLPLRVVDQESVDQRDLVYEFRHLVRAIAADCLGLRVDRHHAALDKILSKAATVDQTTLDETKDLLRDHLPFLLSQLKLPTTDRAQEALRKYQSEDSHLHRVSAPIEQRHAQKSELWRDVSDSDVAVELLSSVRARIREFGYSSKRILFELFQNADDAYRQLENPADNACFRIEVTTERPGAFRVIHWGRPINHLGWDPEDGRKRGHGRDLLNMLMMNFSDKRPKDDLTGKFGLGFKCVHLLSERVGIASGFIALRTAGGFLPKRWPDGLDLAERCRSRDGRRATLIDVPFSDETSSEGQVAIDAFRTAMCWLPACGRAIRRIQFDDGNPVIVESVRFDLLGQEVIGVINIRGEYPRRALCFDLEDSFQFFVAIEADGPTAFPSELAPLWNLAPLEEELPSGWLLNGPFAVDPGRGRLAGSTTDRKRTFDRLGRVLAERLLTMYDLAHSNWTGFAEALHLHSASETAGPVFWSHLYDLFQADFDDELSFCLHASGQGFRRLVAERPVVPTRLPRPFDNLVRASDIEYCTSEALKDNSILKAVQDWPTVRELSGRIVASDVADQLHKLRFNDIRPLTITKLLDREMGHHHRVDPTLAQRLGQLLSTSKIEREPLHRERGKIFNVAAQALFLAADGAWRPVRKLTASADSNEEERRLSLFAPDSALLNDLYKGTALEFFRVARSWSGYGPDPKLLLKWAQGANSPDGRNAVFRYVIEGTQGRALARALRENRPTWIPQSVNELLAHPLLADWGNEDRERLLFELGDRHFFDFTMKPHPWSEPCSNPETLLGAVHTWWSGNRVALRKSYADRTYPSLFSPEQLIGSDDRTAWFTLFALGCFQSMGRMQEYQHRSYIEGGLRDGWWSELALSRPPDNVAPWLQRLEHWSSAEHLDQDFLPWRRLFVDLYSVARWLDRYIEIVRCLPRIIEEHGTISLNDVLKPSFSPSIQRLAIDAAPLARSMGIGINWIVRELLRCGFYEPIDESLVAPYCWASTRRVRKLLTWIGSDVGKVASADASRTIHAFVVESIGPNRARFTGDFDLPFHEITRRARRSDLQRCLAEAGYSPDAFEFAAIVASDETRLTDWMDR